MSIYSIAAVTFSKWWLIELKGLPLPDLPPAGVHLGSSEIRLWRAGSAASQERFMEKKENRLPARSSLRKRNSSHKPTPNGLCY